MRPRNLLIGTVLPVLFIPWQAGAHRHIPDRAASSFAGAWSDNDVDEMLGFFADDADLYYPFASYVQGRDNIATLLRSEFEGQMSGSRLEMVGLPLVNIQIHDQAVVEFDARLEFQGKTVPLLMSMVLEKPDEAHNWVFTSLRLLPQNPPEPQR
jgi:hypothetical protein